MTEERDPYNYYLSAHAKTFPFYCRTCDQALSAGPQQTFHAKEGHHVMTEKEVKKAAGK